MKIELFPYQREGVEWLKTKRFALLADEMGLGKTAQAIVAADEIGVQNILVVCPANLRENWRREFEKFSSRKRKIAVIETRRGPIPDDGCLIFSYDIATSLLESGFNNRDKGFDLFIADEAHFLKSRTAKRTRSLLGKLGFAHASKRAWYLSGTPCPNNASELWPLLYTHKVTAAKYQDFVDHFCDQIPSNFGYYGKQIVGTNKTRIPELQKLLAPIMLRRLITPGMLPPIFFSSSAIRAGAVPLSEHEGIKTQLEKAEVFLSENESIEGLEAMLPSVSSLRRFIGLQKIEPIGDIIAQELEAGEYKKIVIFAIHRTVIEKLAERLKEFGVVTMYGGQTSAEKQYAVDSFQNDRDRNSPRVFIGNIQSAGVGITLTAAHHVVLVEEDWVPGNNAQAVMRCRRIGQKFPVQVRTFYIPGTLDEKIQRIVMRKTKELTLLLDRGNPESLTG